MTSEHLNVTDYYFTDAQLAALLGISVVRLRNKVSAQEPLPPYIQPPGCRKRLWNREQVNDWLSRFTIVREGSQRGRGAKALRYSEERPLSKAVLRP